jgi:hypothetical protein
MPSSTATIELRNQSQSAATHESAPPGERRSSDHDVMRNEEEEEEEDDVLVTSRIADSTVPDGGYGWVVVAAGAVILWWAVGTTYSWGVVQTALVDQGLSSPAVLSFIGGLNASLISALAIINSRLMRSLGAQKMSAIGVLCMGGSEILSSFTIKNVGAFFFTAGVIMGVGIR